MFESTSATQPSIRQQVAALFTGGYDTAAVVTADTNTGSQYALTVRAGRPERTIFRRGDMLTYNVRYAWATYNGLHLPEVEFVGLHLPTATFGLFDKDGKPVRWSSSLSDARITPAP